MQPDDNRNAGGITLASRNHALCQEITLENPTEYIDEDCLDRRISLQQPKSSRDHLVIGGGNSGVEAAIDLANIVGHVTLFEFAGELKADDILQKRLYSLSNVDVILNAQTLEVLGSDKVNSMIYLDRKTNEKKTIALEGIFIQIGLLPNTDFVKNTVDLSKFGEIIIDSHGQSSLPGLFAAGDVTTVPYKQIIIAMGEGAKASLGAFDYLIRQ